MISTPSGAADAPLAPDAESGGTDLVRLAWPAEDVASLAM
jgi:hypothetical protein